eukprot:TRINITY_DN3189_c2_g1_i1.p1 TRINITY_DN3189_c2_g1~~TRINITY_DN3189_c2_g1_i1.p1  ORF type:complete len:224 (+),score=41.77 TRINITY_DN3189_c2_g1_i1:167-838(+)
MWTQLEDLIASIRSLADNSSLYDNGYHIVAHSQGGLLSRAAIQTMDDHKVRNFVSLAGVQLGEYGVPVIGFPWLQNLTEPLITSALYTDKMQKSVSIAGYWYDPLNHTRYLESNVFLPVINNENGYNPRFKENLNRINSAHFYVSPSDGVIKPWNSALLSQYDSSGRKIVEMKDQEIYKKDTFGLRSLDESGKVFLNCVQKVPHTAWLAEKSAFEKYVLPWLD